MVVDMGATVIVRFGGTVEQVLASEIIEIPSLHSALRTGSLSDPTDAVIRAQALAIGSVNDQWGVFSRSRVQLLPHQLWVCRKVNQEWPFRWLVADDVGLGKTIECGLGSNAIDRLRASASGTDTCPREARPAVAVPPQGHV